MSNNNDVGRVRAPRKLLNHLRRSVSRLAPARLVRTSRAATANDDDTLVHLRRQMQVVDELAQIPMPQRTGKIRISACPETKDIDIDELRRLPAMAEAILGDRLEKFGWEGPLAALLAGTRDAGSPLAALREHEATIVREIHSYVSSPWAGRVKRTLPASLVGRSDFHGAGAFLRFDEGRKYPHWSKRVRVEGAGTTSRGFRDGFVAFARCGRVEFPPPADRNANMMPFVLGDRDSLPDHLQCYFPLIEQCPYMKEEEGKVVYLTVHESYVDAGEAQRREGLHVETPGTLRDDDGATASFTPGDEHAWGMGVFWGPDKYEGGIFMASSVAATSQVWDALVDTGGAPGIVDRHGGCEHLRGLIGRPTVLGAGELIWMTDQTPHEALPQGEGGHRQFFRLVMPRVSHWFADHSTENPLVPLPSDVTVVRGNKFIQSLSELEAST